MSLVDSELNPQTSSKNRLFSKMGFMKMAKKVKWNGFPHAIWYRGATPNDNDDIRKILDATMSESDFGEIDQKSSTLNGGFDDLFGTF
jgi:hypothetical protein